MIQTDHYPCKCFFTCEEDGEYYLVSATDNFGDSWAGWLYGEDLMTGETQLGDCVFAFDDSGVPYPNPGSRETDSPLWKTWMDTLIFPVE